MFIADDFASINARMAEIAYEKAMAGREPAAMSGMVTFECALGEIIPIVSFDCDAKAAAGCDQKFTNIPNFRSWPDQSWFPVPGTFQAPNDYMG